MLLNGRYSGRSLRWERGLKSGSSVNQVITERRSLRWERGLKWFPLYTLPSLTSSFPSLGTWIEIHVTSHLYADVFVVPFAGNVDWNATIAFMIPRKNCRSLHWERGLKSAAISSEMARLVVVPFAGNVDWNSLSDCTMDEARVVPFAGNVDWISNKFPAYLP